MRKNTKDLMRSGKGINIVAANVVSSERIRIVNAFSDK